MEKLRRPPPQVGRVPVSAGRAGQTRRSGPLRSVGDLLEQVEQRRVGPVDVVDHDDERLALGEHREQRAPGAVQLDAERGRLEPRELLVARVEADRERERRRPRRGRSGRSSATSASTRATTTSAGSSSEKPATRFRISASGQ